MQNVGSSLRAFSGTRRKGILHQRRSFKGSQNPEEDISVDSRKEDLCPCDNKIEEGKLVMCLCFAEEEGSEEGGAKGMLLVLVQHVLELLKLPFFMQEKEEY